MSESRFRLFDARELEAVLERRARQAALIIGERPTTWVGVLRRGAPLAEMLGEHMQIAPDDVIECNVPPYESEFRVDLWRLRAEA